MSPDPRSGLVRIDLGNKMGELGDGWIATEEKAICWHPLKEDEASTFIVIVKDHEVLADSQSYIDAYSRAQRYFKFCSSS